MERKYKITIPEPCTENWDKMTPNENGRFCLSCNKTVIDFSTKSTEEIQRFIIQNQKTKICGRFKKSQLDSIIIQIPRRILYKQTQYHKIFLLALFIAMGTTLFSCQDKNGNKQKIDKVEVVEDSVVKESIAVEETLRRKVKHDSQQAPAKQQINKIKTEKDKFVKPEMIQSGEPVASKNLEKDNLNIVVEDNYIYGAMPGIQVNADYYGGIQEFCNIFRKEYVVSRKAKKTIGEVQVSFVIEKNGHLDEIKIIKDLGKDTGKESVRILNSIPQKWYPGETNGRKVRTFYTLHFVLEQDSFNDEVRKRKFSKITSIEIIKTGESNEQSNSILKP